VNVSQLKLRSKKFDDDDDDDNNNNNNNKAANQQQQLVSELTINKNRITVSALW
jgi:hypothetical protein